MQHTLPDFIQTRGGVALRPGDGIIHSWLNRMLLPDTVGTGGDSHTRFPMGISFPAGSGLVAFAAATGVMPLEDRKSTRLNSSHVRISYAVFCLKKKKHLGPSRERLHHVVPSRC